MIYQIQYLDRGLVIAVKCGQPDLDRAFVCENLELRLIAHHYQDMARFGFIRPTLPPMALQLAQAPDTAVLCRLAYRAEDDVQPWQRAPRVKPKASRGE